MTLKEKKSQRKAKAIRYLVESGEYSAQYGLNEVERLNDEGLILDVDYEPLAEYLEELINKELPEDKAEEPVEEVPTEEAEESYVE